MPAVLRHKRTGDADCGEPHVLRLASIDVLHFQIVNFSDDSSGFVLERSPLRRVIFFGIPSRTVFKIQVAQIVIENLLPLSQEFQPALASLRYDRMGIKTYVKTPINSGTPAIVLTVRSPSGSDPESG
jgi:hypothetical protein